MSRFCKGGFVFNREFEENGKEMETKMTEWEENVRTENEVKGRLQTQNNKQRILLRFDLECRGRTEMKLRSQVLFIFSFIIGAKLKICGIESTTTERGVSERSESDEEMGDGCCVVVY